MIAPPLWPFDSETDRCGKVSAESPEPCQFLEPSYSSPFSVPFNVKAQKVCGVCFDHGLASHCCPSQLFSSHCFHHA